MFKIAINAGHGYNTAGKRCLKSIDSNETREYILNKRICDIIESSLKQYEGVSILRIDDGSELTVSQRTKTANEWGADFYLAVHHNAGINGGKGGGIEVYVYTYASSESKDWQKRLYDALIKHTGLKGNRAEPLRKANLGECRQTNMPSVLLELGFMDSKVDTPIILTDEYAAKCAIACLDVIVSKAGLKKKENMQIVSTDKNNKITEWQKAAIADGFKFPKYGADGLWGIECEEVAKKAICKKRITYKYKNLTKIVQMAVGVSADGKFGKNTKTAVIKWQELMGLTADGCVGINTWKKILGVK